VIPGLTISLIDNVVNKEIGYFHLKFTCILSIGGLFLLKYS